MTTTPSPPTLLELSDRDGDIALSELHRRLDAAKEQASLHPTSTVVALAREYKQHLRRQAYELDNLNAAMYQIRRLLSDALRDAGCDHPDTHDAVLNGWGIDVVRAIIETAT